MLEVGQEQLKRRKETLYDFTKAWTRVEESMRERARDEAIRAHVKHIQGMLTELRGPIRATHAAFDSTERFSEAQTILIGKLYQTLTTLKPN